MSDNPKISLKNFNPDKNGTAQVLGELQSAVMETLWLTPNLTVSQVEKRLQEDREIAHTTVLTTLDRMHRKGLLLRQKEGKAFVYSTRLSKAEFERGIANQVMAALFSQFTEPALSAFVDVVGEDDAILDQLEEMIRAKKASNKD